MIKKKTLSILQIDCLNLVKGIYQKKCNVIQHCNGRPNYPSKRRKKFLKCKRKEGIKRKK